MIIYLSENLEYSKITYFFRNCDPILKHTIECIKLELNALPAGISWLPGSIVIIAMPWVLPKLNPTTLFTMIYVSVT